MSEVKKREKMKCWSLYIFLFSLSIYSCRDTIGDKPSQNDIQMEKNIVGHWIFDTGNPLTIDSTILYFDLNKQAMVIDYGIADTFEFRFKIRDSILTLVSYSNYPDRFEIDYRINYLDDMYLTISRQYPQPYSKTYRKYYGH